MKKTNYHQLVVLLVIIFVGLFLRLYRLNLNTPSLYSDETSQYLIASSISNNGLVINIRDSLISYTWFLGLNPLGVRLPPALYGSILIAIAYFIGITVSKGNGPTSLLMALLTALAPWSFMISRIGHASVPLMLIFIGLHLYLYLKAKNISDYLFCLFPLVLATVYYPSMVIISPIIFLIISVDILKQLSKKQKVIFSIILFPLLLLLGLHLSSRYNLFSLKGRAMDLAIWRDVNTPWQIDKYRTLTWNTQPTIFSFNIAPEKLANKLVYNRFMANLSTFAHNYFFFYSPDWLFFKGDAILRHSTGQVGAFYPALIPFMLYGAFVFFNTVDKKRKTIFLIWILASPIPAAITKDGAGYLLRVVTPLPFLTYFCALGLSSSFNLVRRNLRIFYGILITLLGLYSAYYFYFGYFHVYPSLSARSYEYGFKELSDFQLSHHNAVLLIVWDGYYHNNDFRFWQATPFNQFNAFKPKESVVGDSHFIQTYSNLYFVNPKNAKDVNLFIKQNKIEYLVLPDPYFLNYPVELNKVFSAPTEIIKYPDQTVALEIFSTNKQALPKVSKLVTRIIDGDTFEIEGGQKVRLIGIDTPELKNANKLIDCYAVEARQYLIKLISDQKVDLERDVSDVDRYGRLLRYVYLNGEMVNDRLIKTGYAKIATFPPDVKYVDLLLSSQQLAIKQNLGLWSACKNSL